MSADDARAEAYRRYDGDRIIDDRTGEEVPHDDWGFSESDRQAFVAGAEWQASRPFTEEDVEAAAEAIFDYERNASMSGEPWPDWDHSDTQKGIYRDLARAALDAVTARRTKGDGA